MTNPLDKDLEPVADKANEATVEPDLSLTEEEEAALKQRLEELRKRDPFIYR